MRIRTPKHWPSTVHKFENAFQMVVIIEQKMSDKGIKKSRQTSQNARHSLTSIPINKLVKNSEPETDVQRTVPGSAQVTNILKIFPLKKSNVSITCHCPCKDYSQIMVVSSRKGAAGLVAFPHNQLLTLKLMKKRYQRNSQDALKFAALAHVDI
jgi:hypothetical protein